VQPDLANGTRFQMQMEYRLGYMGISLFKKNNPKPTLAAEIRFTIVFPTKQIFSFLFYMYIYVQRTTSRKPWYFM
jgi:hypothetical protein